MNHKKWLKLWCYFVWVKCIMVYPGVEAGVVVSVQLMTYSNPQSLNIKGACCDPGCARCNYLFKLCVADTARSCVLSGTTGRWNNINDIVFTTGDLGGGVRNPMVTTLTSWKGVLRVNVSVEDYDYMSWNDLVDKYAFSKRLVPTAGVLSQTWTETKLTGKVSSMVIRYSVQCTRDYYGASCTTQCIPRDDSGGHYTCDLRTGGRVCRPGWYGGGCLVYCTTHDDDTNGHYTCHKGTGSKVCLANWYGTSCKTHCAPRNDSGAGYTCDVTGSRVCLPGWYPTRQCETYCVPRNDSSAGYTCDVKTGRKTCFTGWHGPDCDCQPRNDSNAGFVCNETTGERVCRPGWHGRDCNEYCTPRNDSTGHYICNVLTGEKECLANWIGDNCEVYCKSDNTDSTECVINGTILCRQHYYGANCSEYCNPGYNDHYTCDRNTGAKVCVQGWYGENCTTACVPRDDDWYGHYDCNINGSRQCHSNWYGLQCKTYCKPQSDDILGHYTCNTTNGNPVCAEDWYGPNCATYCRPRDGPEGHYSCGAADGERVCLRDWYGVNCTVNCVPSDNRAGHYTCDGTTGQKLCVAGWRGVNCHESTSTTERPTLPPSEVPPSTSHTEEPEASVSPTSPLKGESRKKRSDGTPSDLELALMLGGFVLLLLVSAVIVVVICSRRSKRPPKQFAYKRYNNTPVSELRDPRTSPREHHTNTEGLQKDSAPKEAGKTKSIRQNVVNLLAEYDDEAARKTNDNVYITLKEVTWYVGAQNIS